MAQAPLGFGATVAAAQTFKSVQVLQSLIQNGAPSASTYRNFFYPVGDVNNVVCLWAFVLSGGLGSGANVTRNMIVVSTTQWAYNGDANNSTIIACFAEFANTKGKTAAV